MCVHFSEKKRKRKKEKKKLEDNKQANKNRLVPSCTVA